MNTSRLIKLNNCEVSLLEDSIIYTIFYSTENFDLEEVKLLDSARYDLSNGKPFYSLVSFIGALGSMSREAQEFLAKEGKCVKLIKFEVILIDSLPVRILVKTYIKWVKPPFNTSLNKKYEEGLKLLQDLRDSN